MKPAASLELITLLAAFALSAPAFAQDVPPPFEEDTDIDYGEDRAVQLGEDIYSEDDEEYDDDDPEEAPTFEEFKRELSPHGRWVDTREYGWVWVPRVRYSWWRPYSYGEWIYTRHGWTFVSYDPWGTIPFHYGRWVYRSHLGWCWIPGYVWGPAWVSWRYGGTYVAWAPLGPDGVSAAYYSTPSLWIAVNGPDFRRPLRHRHFIPTSRIKVVFRDTREYRAHRHGPTVEYVTKVTRAPVRRAKIVPHVRPYRRVHKHGNTTVIRTGPAVRHVHPEKRVVTRQPSRTKQVIVKQAPKSPQVRVEKEPDRKVKVQRSDKRVKVKRERGERHRH